MTNYYYSRDIANVLHFDNSFRIIIVNCETRDSFEFMTILVHITDPMIDRKGLGILKHKYLTVLTHPK